MAEFTELYYGFAVDEFISISSLDQLNDNRFNDIQRFVIRMEKSLNYYVDKYYVDKKDSSYKGSIYGKIENFINNIKSYYNNILKAYNDKTSNDINAEYTKYGEFLKNNADHIMTEINTNHNIEILKLVKKELDHFFM
jgi:hypothetical protein